MLTPKPHVFRISDRHYVRFEMLELDAQKCLSILLSQWSESFRGTNLTRGAFRIVHKTKNAAEVAQPLFLTVRAISDGFERFTNVKINGRIAKVENAIKTPVFIIELELREPKNDGLP